MPNGQHMNQRNISKLIGLRSHMIQDNKNFIKKYKKRGTRSISHLPNEADYEQSNFVNYPELFPQSNKILYACYSGIYLHNEEHHRISGSVSCDVAIQTEEASKRI